MIRVMLVDDHRMVLDGLKKSIDSESDMKSVLLAESGKEALEMMEGSKIDVAVIDVTMPEMNGVVLTKKIKERNPEVAVVALSMYADNMIVSEMLKSGATCYVMKDCGAQCLLLAIRSASTGGVYFSKGVGKSVIDDYVKARDLAQEPGIPSLTEREMEVLQLLVEGKKVQEIEKILSISRHTVNSHRTNIMTKLGCETFVDLIRYCIREGICDLD